MPRALCWLAAALLVIGIGLTALNVVGLAMPLRSPMLADYREPGWTQPLLPGAEAVRWLSALSADESGFIAAVHAVFTYAIAHPVPESLLMSRADGGKPGLTAEERRAFGLIISPYDNWFLSALSLLKKSGYYGHAYCNWRRAVIRGIGDCEQQAIALVGYFTERGFDTGFLMGWSHVAPMVRDSQGEWWLADPDFGVLAKVTPDDLLAEPGQVRGLYDGVRNRGDGEPFGVGPFGPPRFALGGPASRYPIACPIERLSYVLKWAIPGALIGIGACILFWFGWPASRCAGSKVSSQ